MAKDGWIAAVGGYAERLHAWVGDGHHVVSPLGAWMVVALCSTLADGVTRDELAEVLGGDPSEAARFVAGLLADPHPLVAAGAGLWVRPAFATSPVEEWLAGLPAAVDTGDIPTQEQADAWAAARTLGLIDRFPIVVTADVVCVLATVLATRVSWEVPFTVVDSAALAPSPWADQVRRVLQAPRDPRHRQYLADTDRAGTVAVHLTGARGGLLVGSVIAADRSLPSSVVLAAAEEIVTAEARQAGSVAHKSLFDLPLSDGPVWTITEEEVETTAGDGREEHVVSILPAWSAETYIDLAEPGLGYPVAARALGAALGLPSFSYDASQAATASYSAAGFEAAAVTALMMWASAPTKRPGRRRYATVRFGHPYAVVAAAFDDRPHRDKPDRSRSRWHGLPVFSAWVSEPDDAKPMERFGGRTNVR